MKFFYKKFCAAFLFSALLLFFNSSFACSCGGTLSFCECHDNYDLAASCVVVNEFPHGISLRILHILHGIESRDTIKVLDLGGPYNMCNDSLAEASAKFLGSIGDTLIIALPKIDTTKNVWDVIGDYRTPGFQCEEYKLRVVNNTVTGLISGSSFCYFMNNCLNSYNYDDFIVDFPSKSLSCQTWLNTDELSAPELFKYSPNPATDEITLTYETENHAPFDAYIYDVTGKCMAIHKNISDKVADINVRFLPPGYYLMKLTDEHSNSASGSFIIAR